MKKLIYLLIVAFFYTSAVVAKTITSDIARTVATNFFKQNADMEVKTVSLVYTETSESGEAVYFVYNINSSGVRPSSAELSEKQSNGGFVIVVADDALYPVIGYSTEGPFVVPAPSSNAGYWMEQRKKEIITNRMQNVQASSEISAQWSAYLNSRTVEPRIASAVSPLCKALWDQGSPYYNALCPGGSQTGCVATAMAQIMRYWKYPARGTGSSSYTSASYGVLSANYGNTTYNWNNMPTGNVTSANNDVATIMYQCGVSVEMIYAPLPGGSGASTFAYENPSVCAQFSYARYFGYDSATIKGLQRFNYTDQKWINIIEADLNAGRPVHYSGFDATYGGHSWVCDGYEANNYLHMNWGASGNFDGYFSINLLNPYIFNFTSEQEAMIGLQPKSTTGIPSIPAAESFSIYPNPASTQLTIHTPSFSTGTTTVSIINLLGQEVLSNSLSLGEGRGEAIDISKFPAGMYFLQMKSESGIAAQRFVKE